MRKSERCIGGVFMLYEWRRPARREPGGDASGAMPAGKLYTRNGLTAP